MGQALVRALRDQGAQVAVSSRGVSESGPLNVPCDVTQDASVAGAVRKVVSALGEIDVAILAAGQANAGTVDLSVWQQQFDVHLLGAVRTVSALLPHLAADGRVGLIATAGVDLGLTGLGPYLAAKAALRAFGRGLSREWKGTEQSCTVLYPGFVGLPADERVPNWLLTPPDRAARQILRALHRRRREAGVGLTGSVLRRVRR